MIFSYFEKKIDKCEKITEKPTEDSFLSHPHQYLQGLIIFFPSSFSPFVDPRIAIPPPPFLPNGNRLESPDIYHFLTAFFVGF